MAENASNEGRLNMNLYIIRHAIAVARGTPGYDDESQRPLTDKGIRKMNKIANGLRKFDLKLDMILSSPYVRARDTARILASEFQKKDQLGFSDNLIPPGNFETLVAEIHEKYDVDNLALVGHEPMLSQFVSWLTTGDTGMNLVLKKGGACYLSADNLYQNHRANLVWLLTPALMLQLSK